MVRSPLIVVVAAMYLPLGGCGSSQPEAMVTKTMRAGPNEPTFAEAYDPSIRLPMGIEEFEALLKKLGLHYSVLSGPNPSSAMPLPSKDSGISRDDLAQCIQIYGKRNDAERSMQIFRAYVNKESQVFYVENAFAYTGP